jgi:hypothetical protein
MLYREKSGEEWEMVYKEKSEEMLQGREEKRRHCTRRRDEEIQC